MNENKIIDGKLIASQIKEEIKREVANLKEEKNIIPGLAFILVGENPASVSYVKSKGKACEELGFYSITKTFPESISESAVLELIKEYNEDKKIHGILVQLPLPRHIDEERIIESIDYKKDVDGFHPINIGRLLIGVKGFISCTPYGIIELLRRYDIDTKGKNVVVIGRSNIVGKPVANLFIQKSINSTVTICHSFTRSIKDYTLNADIIIAAIGKPLYIKNDMIKDGCVIIDVGINRISDASKKSGSRIVGDVDFEDCIDKCSRISPVPGGVGLMTIAMLMRNTIDAASGKIYE